MESMTVGGLPARGSSPDLAPVLCTPFISSSHCLCELSGTVFRRPSAQVLVQRGVSSEGWAAAIAVAGGRASSWAGGGV